MPPRRHRVAVLVLPSVVMFDLAVPLQIFGYPRPDAGTRRYQVVVCSRKRGRVPTASGFPIVVAHGLEALRTAQTVVIPGIEDTTGAIPADVCRALRRAHLRGARLMSICTGAFVLAAAGLLNGRHATTHWIDAPDLQTRYPDVDVDAGVLYVDEGSVLTSAGLAAGIDACLHVVRADHGPVVANAVARRMIVPAHRSGGQAQFIPRPVPTTDGSGLEPTRRWLLSRLAESITIPQMAAHGRMSTRTFGRRFAAEVGIPPLRWLLRERIRASQVLLETSDYSIAQVASRCGFGSVVAFRAHFRNEVRISPAAYRANFRHM